MTPEEEYRQQSLARIAHEHGLPVDALTAMSTADRWVTVILNDAVFALQQLELHARARGEAPELVISQTITALEELAPVHMHAAAHRAAELLNPPDTQ